LIGAQAMTDIKTYQIADFTPLCRMLPAKHILASSSMVILEDCVIVAFGKSYGIQKGFITDGATVPWFLRPAFPAVGKYLGATTIHDWFCAEALKTGKYELRRHADLAFYDHLMLCGTNKYRARLMSRAVIWYGKRLKRKGVLK